MVYWKNIWAITDSSRCLLENYFLTLKVFFQLVWEYDTLSSQIFLGCLLKSGSSVALQ